MPSFRQPAIWCAFSADPGIDEGTLCRSRSPSPGFFGAEPEPATLRPVPPHPSVRMSDDKTVISGLLYPLEVPATADYHTGPRRFGSDRKDDKGHKRLHAGIDLYAPAGTVVRAMADGVVIRVAYFYCKTWAIEVDHGCFLARYGEVDPSKENIFVKAGQSVSRGQRLGLVGKLVGVKVPSNMLHLELYTSTNAAELTIEANAPFQRRSDLMDPTRSMDQAVHE